MLDLEARMQSRGWAIACLVKNALGLLSTAAHGCAGVDTLGLAALHNAELATWRCMLKSTVSGGTPGQKQQCIGSQAGC